MNSSSPLADTFNTYSTRIDEFLSEHFSTLESESPEQIQPLYQSIIYTLMNGGKRFRPVLCMMTADAFNLPLERVLPFAAAVEMVHTYSLIHDDLPCMDHDDERRGQPTNHKVHGEDLALLAGDALLTEAFSLLSRSYHETPDIALQLIQLLSQKSGVQGMIGGQVIDLKAQKQGSSFDEVQLMHKLKTGALIYTCVQGCGVLARASEEETQHLHDFGYGLGLCFQITDDLHDHDEQQPEPGSFPALLGLEESRARLQDLTQECIQNLEFFKERKVTRVELCLYNQHRTH